MKPRPRRWGSCFILLSAPPATACQFQNPKEVADGKAELLQNARKLREIADDLSSTNSADPLAAADAEALRRVAGWQEAGAAALRPPSDPLTIQNDRGDRVV